MISHRKIYLATEFLQKAIIFFFHFLLLVLPFVFTWVNAELFEFNKMLFVYTVAIIIGSLWCLRMVLERKVIWKRTKFDWVLGFFLASQLISTVTSMHPATSIFGYYTRFHGGLLSTVAYLTLFYALVSNVETKHLKAFLKTLSLAAFLVCLYAIPEHFGHSFSCTLINGQFSISCWVQDVQHRIFGSFGQPNWLAAYVVTVLPVVTALMLSVKDRSPKLKTAASRVVELSFSSPLVQRILLSTIGILLVVCLIFTGSRSGFLGLLVSGALFVGGLALIFIKSSKSEKKNLTKLIKGMIPLVIGAFLVFVIWGTPLTPSATQLLKKSEPASPDATQSTPVVNRLEQGGTDSGEIRKIVWQGAINIWHRYPWFGSGVETFAYSYYQDRPAEHNLVSEWDFLYNKAHNEFLNFLATTGLVGLVAYLSIIGMFVFVSAQSILSHQQSVAKKILVVGLISGFLGLAVSNFFGFSTVVVGLLFFLYPALYTLITQSSSKQLTKSLKNKRQIGNKNLVWWQLVSVFVVVAIAAQLLAAVSKIWAADYYYAAAQKEHQADHYENSLSYLNQSIELLPHQATFYNLASQSLVKLAITLATNGQLEEAQQTTTQALLAADKTFELNPVHLNFYKTQISNLITLSQLSPEFLRQAEQLSNIAISLAPTDAKLYFYLSLIQMDLGDQATATQTLEETIKLRPNYQKAREYLATQYINTANYQAALDQYRYILDNLDPDNQNAQQAVISLEASLSGQRNQNE